MVAVFDHHAVDAGTQLRQCAGFVFPLQGFQWREDRDFDAQCIEFVTGDGFKARVVERRGEGVAAQIFA